MRRAKPAGSERMTTAEAAIATMVGNGIDTLFCLPGVQNDNFFDALHKAQDKVRPIHTRHEQATAYMALGSAMATGQPAVYSVVPGPGFLNTTAALSTAYACNAPVLALVGQIQSATIGHNLGQLHEIPDQLGIMRLLTKSADRIRSPVEAPAKMTEAFRQMRSGRPRPVALECPIDVWGRTANVTLPSAPAAADPMAIDTDAVATAARLLGGSKRPLIVVGSGAQAASAEVTELANALQAPVVANRMGRGVLDGRNPLSVNTLEGHALWAEADVVLAVGTRLLAPLQSWGTDEDMKIIRVDADPDELDRIGRPAVGIVGDAAPVLRAIIAAMGRHASRRPSRTEEMQALHARTSAKLAYLQPQLGLLEAIRAELPENGIFVDELTQLGYVSRLTFPTYAPRSFISPGYQGTLGWGLATALGVKVGRPDAPVVSVTGDGGFMFNVQELATAVQHRIPIVVVLVNDGAYGNVRRIQVQSYGNRVIASDLQNPDFMKLVESFGAQALRAKTPDQLRKALRKGFAADLPTVIEVPAGPMPDPWQMTRPGRVRPRTS
ncbi:thiamine pyrophosphate-dependent enzyme [Limobrevibacterium gyesilva]|uniref:Thiamine pyrophosphate-binding protein n=1 Tax=Limobrevibacterium gyesilva TaxID=2991712 RepID=A0AA42CGL2_9PROT|nr:thiamine pyrophosphate-dependent enzyme [Limobrevibacterium gyesilva]MCW3476176.1 thiamine pyrophosphate-binding protein [Limobrevibacterium gyesilva]